ncbi:MAG: AMP-binding protein, partial [SAR324 cluster bacterium]|nr:AMP-binding protein [SAR324 cluster bacterium]
MSQTNPFEIDLDRRPANYQPLTPLSLLERSAGIYPDKTAIIHGSQRITYRDFWQRSLRLASALNRRGIGRGDTVSVMAPNTPQMLEAHFGVPMSGAVLNSLNIRLDGPTIGHILEHGEAKILLTDTEFAPVIREALAVSGKDLLVIDIDDPEGDGGERLGSLDYEDFLKEGTPDFEWIMPEDEWDAISLNYTSGTT